MNGKFRYRGSALFIPIFTTSLLSAITIDILQLNTDEIAITTLMAKKL